MGSKTKKIKTSHFHTVVIGTFSAWKNGQRSPTNGMIEPLISFFGPKSDSIVLIDCPHPGSDDIIPKIDYYQNGTLIKQINHSYVFPPQFILRKFNEIKTQPTFKIRDFITTVQILLSQQKKVDLFIGLESIFALAGILLKKFGKINTVVYYVSDYSPARYSSKILNAFYLWLDRFCATYSDFIWDVSKAMMPARIKVGLKKENSAPVIHVPNALFPSQIKYLPVNKLEPNSLVFAGTIGPENGLDLAIEAFSIAKKKFNKLTLHIIGSGLKQDEEYARHLIEKLKLTKDVKNYGFIFDLNTLSNTLKHFMVGIAPYRAFPWSVRWYADATKMRLYFASGLPVITTHVPPLGKEAKEKGCAIVVKDNKEEFANAIVEILINKKKYIKYRNAAILFAKNNTWENTYSNAMRKMGLLFV